MIYEIKKLKETEFTFFLAVIFPAKLINRIMIEAYKQGIAVTGLYTWIFSDGIGFSVIGKLLQMYHSSRKKKYHSNMIHISAGRDFPNGSPLGEAYRGTCESCSSSLFDLQI